MRGTKFHGKTQEFRSLKSKLDIIHLFLLTALVEKLLEIDAVGGGVYGGLEALPGGAEFGGAIFITQRRRVEDFAVHGAEDFAKGNFRRGAGEEVTAFFAADTFGDAFGFQFEEDLNKVICRHTLRRGEMLDAQGRFIWKMPRQSQHCPRGIITFNRKLHSGKLADQGGRRKSEGGGRKPEVRGQRLEGGGRDSALPPSRRVVFLICDSKGVASFKRVVTDCALPSATLRYKDLRSKAPSAAASNCARCRRLVSDLCLLVSDFRLHAARFFNKRTRAWARQRSLSSVLCGASRWSR